MEPTDIASFVTVSRPALHPDQTRVAFQTSVLNLDEDRYDTHIWVWDGASAARFTSGDRDAAPAWSPDGSRMAFLRAGDEEGDLPQVAVVSADGGEATIVSSFDLGARELRWSPDGARLLVLATVWTEEWSDLSEDERKRKPRWIEGFAYRGDNRGWMHDRRDRLFVVDPDGGDSSRVGSEDAHEGMGAWSPDGRRIAFATKLDDPRLLRSGSDIVEVDLRSGEQRVLGTSTGFDRPSYDPDGALHAIGNDTPEYPGLTSLWRLEDEPVDLTGHVDRSVFSFLMPIDMAAPDWAEGGFYIGTVDGGRTRLVRFIDGDPEPVIDGDRYITGFSRAESGDIYFTSSSATDPGELSVREADGSERVLTSFNEKFRADTTLVEPAHYRVESEPGVEVDTWLYVPEGDGPFPVLLNIHGGPASQYGFGFFDEFQVYAGAGYAVLACNPRGSSGRGKEWVQAVTGEGWGVVDLTDITAVVDDALERDGRIDGDRIGIMGGSYGGFLTAWTTARDHRYKSAIVERALLHWESFSGTSDIARDFSRNYLGLTPPHDHEALRAASPFDRAAEIATPTLIVHSENDFRCPVEQAEQLFALMLRNGVDVAMVRFPGESHELSRSGKPRHRVERFEYILDWHGKHLS